MRRVTRVAISADDNRGLDSVVSPHFGRRPYYVLVDLDDREVRQVGAALAHLASREFPIVLADADVDAANLELVLDPAKQETQDFTGGKSAVIDPAECTACGVCYDVCRFEAVIPGDEAYRVDSLACEGCAACHYQCPANAIRMEEQRDGQWFRSDTRFGSPFHAHLFAGQENSGKLVTLVKQQARLLG